ncbi:TonB-dependent siderophore receptor [Lichenihabitans sp. Uapishka_5]|uniref:TonB-dependent siderophore receptor n=1 Tax=Lichenihabitans sp. Uapishka_5 TaxID=3037302 RepID=UPI0029E8025B|nr:TonB-dependent siderophore receptor [Lichenihabitans sp. Uapishka_5]MDX7953654.1 TonB-dependent siderophore receptor [Lichenihabitans sp. Uapishka_5]
MVGRFKTPWIGFVSLCASLLSAGGASAQSAAAQGATVDLDAIDVSGLQLRDVPPGTVGYLATRSTAGTKTNTPTIEVPQSQSTVTRRELDDRNVQTLKQAVDYTPGTTTGTFGYDPRFDSFSIRGFDVTYDGVYRDGLRQGGSGFSIPLVEPYGLQDLTILRGPASGLYGLGSPGGIIDLTTKRPTAGPFGELQLQIGQYDRYQGNFDIGGPVVGLDGFSYRLTGLVRESGNWLPGADDNRTYVAPAVTWRPDSDTSVTVLAEHQTSRVNANTSFFQGPNHSLTSLYSNDPAYGAQSQEQYRIGYLAEHRFSDLLTVRQNLRFTHVNVDSKYTQIDGVDDVAGLASRSTGRVIDSFNFLTLDNQAESHFTLGPVANTLLFGVDYQHAFLNHGFGFGSAPDLDIVTRNYGAQPIPNITDLSYHIKQLQDQVGVYAQEQAKWGGFVLTLNGRQSWVDTDTRDLIAATRGDQKDAAFTGRVGLSYLFDNGVAPYVSYATQFEPQLGTNLAGQTFAPTQGEQEEAGIKYQIPGANVLLTAAAFNITQNNVLRLDPSNIAFQAATGQVQSQGVELAAVATLAPGIDVTAAYTRLDVRITRGATDTTGNTLSGIPDDTVSAFAKYTFQPGWRLAGLGVGAGVRYIGSSFGDDQNTFRVRDVALLDAVLDYDFAKLDPKYAGLKLQVNANNLLDTRYQECQSGYCYRGAYQQVIGSLVYRW